MIEREIIRGGDKFCQLSISEGQHSSLFSDHVFYSSSHGVQLWFEFCPL